VYAHAEDARPIVAVAYDWQTGAEYDRAWTWETGQALALEGYRVVAVADDGEYWNRERCQSLYDAELERWADCYGYELPAGWQRIGLED
jgi:hypothetical protein